jgi:signal transduction histidine kinase
VLYQLSYLGAIAQPILLQGFALLVLFLTSLDLAAVVTKRSQTLAKRSRNACFSSAMWRACERLLEGASNAIFRAWDLVTVGTHQSDRVLAERASKR